MHIPYHSNTLDSGTPRYAERSTAKMPCDTHSDPGSGDPAQGTWRGKHQKWPWQWISSAPHWERGQSCNHRSRHRPPMGWIKEMPERETAVLTTKQTAGKGLRQAEKAPPLLWRWVLPPPTHLPPSGTHTARNQQVYLHKGAGHSATAQLVEQSLAHGHIGDTGHTIRNYYNTCKRGSILVHLPSQTAIILPVNPPKFRQKWNQHPEAGLELPKHYGADKHPD